jgi:hypothetical protein
MGTPATDNQPRRVGAGRAIPGSVVTPRALALLACAIGSVGLIGLTLGIAIDASRPRAEVGTQQVVNLQSEAIPVGQGSAAATALVAQLASAGSGAITLNHALALPPAQAQPVRRLVLLNACKGAIDAAHCKSTLITFPPGEQPPMTAAGEVLLRGAFHASPVVDEQFGAGFLVQAAR